MMAARKRDLRDKEVSYYCDISVHTLRAARSRKGHHFDVPPHYHQGRRVLYSKDEVIAWMQAHGLLMRGGLR